MAGTLLDQLADALDRAERIVAGVRAEQWAAATPCTEWSVRDVVEHLIGGNRLVAGLLQETPPPADPGGPTGGDHLGENPVAAYRDAANALVAAFRRPGALERTITVPVGPVPGVTALHLRLVETLVHGWDVAQATDQPAGFPDELAEPELEFSRRMLGNLPPGRTPFAPPQPVPADAPAIDRLAGLLGRRAPGHEPGEP